MKLSLLLAGALLALLGCSSSPSSTSGARDPDHKALTEIPDIGSYALAEPIEVGNMAFIPVVSTRDTKQDVEYATLVEAKKNGWLEIVELPGGQEVNRLHVRNTGPKPVLLLGGELLLGGKQDRIVAHDVVIPAGSEIDVDVYCVEHGRWEGPTTKFEPSFQFAPERVRKAATYEDQSRVWDKVKEYNGAVGGGAAEQSTVNAGLSDATVKKAIVDGVSDVMSKLRSQKNVVGILIANNGEVTSMELFGSPSLFEAAREPLLTSFLSEIAVDKSSSSKKVALSDAAKFVSETLNSQRRLKGSASGTNSLSVGSAGGGIAGREIGGESYEGKPSAKSDGLIHGTYKRGE